MAKISNDQNIKNLKTRKILRWFIIFFGVVTIVLAVLSLTIKLGIGYSITSMLITTILTKKRNSIELRKSDTTNKNNKKLKEVEKIVNSYKKKVKK